MTALVSGRSLNMYRGNPPRGIDYNSSSKNSKIKVVDVAADFPLSLFLLLHRRLCQRHFYDI